MEILIKNIKKLMIEKEITQVKLAKIIGVNQSYISMLLNGKYKDVYLSTLYKLSDALNVSIKELLN